MVDDMINSGANVISADVVTDGNIITCSYYGQVGKFMRAVFSAIERNTRESVKEKAEVLIA
jgi:protease I